MNLFHVIIGPVVTEKAERQKLKHEYTLQVHPAATKIDVMNALRTCYDVTDIASVRIHCVRPKVRVVGRGEIVKRARSKRAFVQLAGKNTTLDLTRFKQA